MRRRLALFSLLLILLTLSGAAFAQTAAGTEITNQATATYLDSAGVSQTAESNEVITTVQPVFGFEIAPNGTLTAPGQTTTAAAGEQAVFTYTVTNIGNDEDTITLSTGQDTGDNGDLVTPVFYLDNGDGIFDPATDTLVTSIDLLAGEDATIFLVGTVPETVTDGGIINVQPVGTSTGDPTYDELDVDGENWAQVTTLTLPDLTLVKTVTPTTGVVPGTVLTYSLTGENVGGSSPFAVTNVATVDGTARSGILISDDFDNALTYVAGSLEASYTPAGTGTAVLLYSTTSGTTWTATQPANGVNAVGLLIQFPAGTRLAAIDAPALAYDLSFDVTVPTTAAEGDSYENTGVSAFDSNGDGDAADPNETEETPPVTSTVDQVPGVNIGNSDGNEATPPSDTPADFPTAAGTAVNMPLELTNAGNGPDTFDLTSAFPPGWTVAFFPDADCDGTPDGTTPITSTPELAAGANICLVAVVTPPVGTTPDTYDVTLTTTSQSNPAVTDSITNTVTVGLTQGFTFVEDDEQTTTPGSTITYTHTATNTSNTTATVSLAITEPGTTGWTYLYGLDANGDGDLTDPGDIPFGPLTAVSGFVLEPGSSANVLVQVTIPATATSGTVDTFTLTATPTYDVDGTPTEGDPVSVTDTTTIIAGTIAVTKQVAVNGSAPTSAPTTAEPLDELTYTIVATNTGDAPVTNVKVSDPLPANTVFESISTTTTGFTGTATVLYSTNGTSWAATLPSLATGQTVYVGVDTNGDNTISGTDSFPADATLTITLTVTIP